MSRGRKVTFELDAALSDVQSGRTMLETAKKYGVCYHTIWNYCKSRGVTGGRHQRDMRPLKDRVQDCITVEPGGCIRWTSPKAHLSLEFRTKRQLIRHLFELPEIENTNFKKCTNRWCLEPSHEIQVKKWERNEEIRRRWSLHLFYSVTLDQLGEEYGVTRQRIQQIVDGVAPAKDVKP